MNKLVKESVIVVFLVVLIDQIVKIWVKTHMFIGESSFHHWGWPIEWFQLAFTENPGMAFGWEIKAKQKDFDQRRLDRNDEPFTIQQSTYGADAAQYITNLRKERESA